MRKLCFGGVFRTFLETLTKHVHYVNKLLYMQQTRFIGDFDKLQGKHRENLIFFQFFGHNAKDCKNDLFWGVFCTFENMRLICTVSQENREMCENGVFGWYFALFLETFRKHVHYVHKLLYMQQARFCRRF